MKSTLRLNASRYNRPLGIATAEARHSLAGSKKPDLPWGSELLEESEGEGGDGYDCEDDYD
ncbi:MAG: hypothetical protein Aurels2KO_46900 [Aureliella sp.]